MERTSGTGYVHLKKQEWIYASSVAIIYLAPLEYWADEIVLYKLSSFIR